MADEKDQTEEKEEEESKEAPEVPKEEFQEEAKEEKKEKSKEKLEPSGKPALPSGRFKDIIKQIEELSVKDLVDLVKELEDRFGVSAISPMVGVGGAVNAVGAGASKEVEEKTEYTIVLTDAGAQKIAVIKAIREIRPDLGLKEAKDLVDGAPKEVKPNVPTDEANAAKSKLEAVGAKVELK